MRRHLEGALWLTSLLSLGLAALAPGRSFLLAMIAIVWLSATTCVVPLHFRQAWMRAGSVPNKREYTIWVGIETLFAVGVIAGLVPMLLSH